MSGINGDKARFNKIRKMKIRRRAQQRLMLNLQPAQPDRARDRNSKAGRVEAKPE